MAIWNQIYPWIVAAAGGFLGAALLLPTKLGEALFSYRLGKALEGFKADRTLELEHLKEQLGHVGDRGRRSNELEFTSIELVWRAFVKAWLSTNTCIGSMKPGDLDELNEILVDWTVRTAKLALDEIASRLKLIEELDQKLRDPKMDEVGDLQPLFERSLWVFGPEFESLEFTSNRGMTEVISKIFGKTEMGSRLRPDFVMLPDGSAGLYSRDAHDHGGDVVGVPLCDDLSILRG
jgi:hypothetical protein